MTSDVALYALDHRRTIDVLRDNLPADIPDPAEVAGLMAASLGRQGYALIKVDQPGGLVRDGHQNGFLDRTED